MYAVVKTGGKQVKAAEGTVMRVEKIDAPVGDIVELTEVSLLVKDGDIVTDPEALRSVKVVCQVMAQDRAKKIKVFKKKRRKNYARTQGHRQYYTELKVNAIVA